MFPFVQRRGWPDPALGAGGQFHPPPKAVHGAGPIGLAQVNGGPLLEASTRRPSPPPPAIDRNGPGEALATLRRADDAAEAAAAMRAYLALQMRRAPTPVKKPPHHGRPKG